MAIKTYLTSPKNAINQLKKPELVKKNIGIKGQGDC